MTPGESTLELSTPQLSAFVLVDSDDMRVQADEKHSGLHKAGREIRAEECCGRRN
jgi:hypothetical protein